MHVVIVAGSTLDGPLDPEALAGADLLIAADGGAHAVEAAGLLPHLLVGDFDSIDDATRRAFSEAGVETLILPVMKDETDSEVALRVAVERGAKAVTVYGALGGPRLDHLLGMVFLLTAERLRRIDVRLVDAQQELFLAAGDCTITGNVGDLVSLLPLTPVVEGICTEGLLYALRGEALRQGMALGVSNELVTSPARVTHGPGHLLVTHFWGAHVRIDETTEREEQC